MTAALRELLRASGPAADRAEKIRLYGQFAGELQRIMSND